MVLRRLVETVLGVYVYQPNIPPQAVHSQIHRAIIVPGSTQNIYNAPHNLIVIGVRSSWVDEYIGYLEGTFHGDIEHIPSMNLHRNYDILDRSGNPVASFFGTIKVAFIPEDQDKVRNLMGLLYRSLIHRDGHTDLDARAMSHDFDQINQRAFGGTQIGQSIAARFFPDLKAIVGNRCVEQIAGGFVGPFPVNNGRMENIRTVIDREVRKDWKQNVFPSFQQQRRDVEHFMISYKRVPFEQERSVMSQVHADVVISMDQGQWEEAVLGANQIVDRSRTRSFYLWLDELATHRSPETNWTKMGFLPYGTFPTVIVGRAYGGGRADMNSGIWTHNERLLTEFGQGWIKRDSSQGPFRRQEGLGLSPFKALTKMAGIYLSGRTYEISEYWSTRLESFRQLCTHIAASEYPVGPLSSLEEEEIHNPMNINRAVQAATITLNNNRFLRDRFRDLFPETFLIPRFNNRPWSNMLEAVPRMCTAGVVMDFDNASIRLWKVVRVSTGAIYVAHFSPQGEVAILIRVQLSGNPFDDTNLVLEAKRVPLPVLSEGELDVIESRFNDNNNSRYLADVYWEYQN